MAGLMTLYLVSINVPLSQWKKFSLEEMGERHAGLGMNTEKQLNNTANAIVNAMSHPDAVELVAKEWHDFPSPLRTRLRMMLNEAASGSGHRSNNKTKGIVRLNKMLAGNVLRQTDDRLTERNLVVRDGRVVSERRFINPAVAGAERAYGAFALPSGFSKMKPAEKRNIRKALAAERKARR